MSECCSCTVKFKGRPSGSAKVMAGLSVQRNIRDPFSAISVLRDGSTVQHGIGSSEIDQKVDSVDTKKSFPFSLSTTAGLRTNSQADLSPKKFVRSDNAELVATSILEDALLRGSIGGLAVFDTGYTDRIGGHFSSLTDQDSDLQFSLRAFTANQKLYPSGDVITTSGDNKVVTHHPSGTNLFESINEGVTVNSLSDFSLLSNNNDYISLSGNLATQKTFTYKTFVNNPAGSMGENYLVMRAIAPLNTPSTNVPPIYSLSNIKLEDPSGNLISKYKDFDIQGDADFDSSNDINYVTYIVEPDINNAVLPTYHDNYPIFGLDNGYTLAFDIEVKNREDDDSFSKGFTIGFDQSSIDTNTVHDDTLRISAIEILTSGSGIRLDGTVNFYSEAANSLRSRRSILPSRVMVNDYDTTIYPSGEHSLWRDSSGQYNNTNTNNLVEVIRDSRTSRNIELISTSDVADSGKLKLRFSHESPLASFRLDDGAFSKSFGAGVDAAIERNKADTDSFFVIDEIELVIVAKKAVSSRDYVIDVVGYSDDRLLAVSPKIGGFLQNASGQHPSGIGVVPVSSGFASVDDLGISTESISDKFQYFESSGTNNLGGDHYSLPLTPVVNSTEFAEYTIPLKIYSDNVTLGQSTDYSQSTFFEHLYLDIYPLPSGASIAHAYLSYTYSPSNALALSTVGHESKPIHVSVSPFLAFPSGHQAGDRVLNSFIQESGLSLIENIPHGYKKGTTLKTNYSRRWRGVDGEIVNGPFDPTAYDYSFYNPELEAPFLSGIYNFTRVNGKFILSNPIGAFEANAISGEFTSNASDSIVENLGLRFNSSGLFTSQRSYKTIDFTQSDHELNGKILDSFDKAIRVSGSLGNINFGSGIPVSSGFSAHVRFSPDVTISGSSYNLWNSGVLLSKYDSGKGLEFALGYSGGFLCARSTDIDGNSIYIQDTQNYTNYQYPLSVLLTYNDSLSSGLKLYADNELASGSYNILRASSTAFAMSGGNSNIVAGYSSGSGIGINAFLTDIGLASYNASGSHIVESGNLRSMQQTTAKSFFDGHRANFWNVGEESHHDAYKLWDYVNEDINDWHLGAFSICEFDHQYDRLTTRIGSDFINFNLQHHGSGYSQITDIAMPTGEVITSGLAYHSQIENDMLRFDISMIPDMDNARLFTVAPRISKSLPRGYDFAERALVVETILENDIDNNVTWPDGKTGPKLIVSLYAPHLEPVTHTTKNYGLVNRHFHYLPQSGCWRKIQSTFTYDDFIDESEPWASFNDESVMQEFGHRYFRSDINEMFIQYDLAYPSGTEFRSNIKLHSINVKAEDALSSGVIMDNMPSGLLFHVNGQQLIENHNMEFFINANAPSSGNPPLSLYSSGSVPPSILNSGTLFVNGTNFISLSPNSGTPLSLFTSVLTGSFDFEDSSESNPVMNFFTDGTTTRPLTAQMPLVIGVDDFDASVHSSGELSLFTVNQGVLEDVQNITLFTHGKPVVVAVNSPQASMPLFTSTDTPEISDPAESMNLFVNGAAITDSTNSAVNLLVMNYPIEAVTSASEGEAKLVKLNWTNQNVGTNILVADSGYAYLSANDEIRGVDLICFGTCEDSSETCTDPEITIHAETFGGECVDGGIFRAKRLYTNLATSGFKTDVGYSGHFYGIRKFEGLVPHSPYDVTIVGQSASDERKAIPKTLSWEYGANDEVNFSGIKMIADGIAGASGNVAPSGARNSGDKYGTSVATNGKYMAVGSPKHNVTDYTGYDLGEAGTVFLYERNTQPTGHDWTNQDDKSGFSFVTELSYPEGLQRDTSSKDIVNELIIDGPFGPTKQELPVDIIRTTWSNNQEGRNLGHSVAISNSGENHTVVVGAPNSKWTRSFVDPDPDPVSIALFVFTRPFVENYRTLNKDGVNVLVDYNNILDRVKDQDIVYKYFCTPPRKIEVKLIVCEPVLDTFLDPKEMKDPLAEGIVHKFAINNHKATDINITPGFNSKDDQIFEQLKEIFNGTVSGVYTHDNTLENSGIPAVVGAFVDDSFSMGEGVLGDALDRFFDYYKEYSLASGVVDAAGNPRAGATVKLLDSQGKHWIDQANSILHETLDTGRMLSSNDFELFATNIGSYNDDSAFFNIPPNSGGVVAVFEEENNNGVSGWNIIQEINSPTVSNKHAADRFGHSVSISDDAKTIVIGSPYTNEAVQIWRQKDTPDDPRDHVENWLSSVGTNDNPAGYLRSMLNRYQSLIDDVKMSPVDARNTVYDELTPSGKLTLRRDNNVSKYELIKTYTHGNMLPDGAWDWLYEKFAPTPRLGYSVDVNEDGSIVAAGAPTDSLCYYDGYNDFNLWWRPDDHHKHYWFSRVNAGSVTLFESRKYYPHSDKAVEFTLFGNKHRTLNIEEDGSGLFNHMAQIYADQNINFTRLAESEVDIPNDAGLAFIITPEIDALSDEVLNNIQDWLGLGDRHLVIVADDPEYEASGVYAGTNNIINDILEKLESRMRVVPARNEYEALLGSNRRDLEGKVTSSGYLASDNNITSAFLPPETTSSYITRTELRASGVADVKLHYPGLEDPYDCAEVTDILDIPELPSKGSFFDYNDRCKMVPKHQGDIRANWIDACEKADGNFAMFNHNLAFNFGTHVPCPDSIYSSNVDSNTIGYEPIPILAASETRLKTVIIPEIPERIFYRDVFEDVEFTTLSFAEEAFDTPAFFFASSGNNYSSLIENLQPTPSPSRLRFEEETKFDHTSIIRAISATEEQEKLEKVEKESFCMVAKETVENTQSEVVLITTTETELESFLISDGTSDQNILFYDNIFYKAGSTTLRPDRMAQLGGWTGTSSFLDARSDSYLPSLFGLRYSTIIEENFRDLKLYQNSSTYDAAWIANPTFTDADGNDVSEAEINKQIGYLKQWLSSGSRRLFITLGRSSSSENFVDPKRINAVETLCSKLGLNMNLLFLSGKGKYATSIDRFVDSNRPQEQTLESRFEMESFNPDGEEAKTTLTSSHSISISTTTDSSKLIISKPYLISDDSFSLVGVPSLKTGVAAVTFPVLAGSGYRIFIDSVSFNTNETIAPGLTISNCSFGPPNTSEQNMASGALVNIEDRIHSPNSSNHQDVTILKQDFVGFRASQERTFGLSPFIRTERMKNDGTLNHEITDIYVPSGDGSVVPPSSITVYISVNKFYDLEEAENMTSLPAMRSIVGISGALLPIEETVRTRSVWSHQEVANIIPAVPATTRVVEVVGEISTGSNKYCPTTLCINEENVRNSGALIEDGPVVTAQELYQQRPFDAGVAKSRITILTDASMIQGNRIADEGGVIEGNVINFLHSLYPTTTFPDTNNGPQYNIISKISAPIKGSPHKFFNSTGNSGLMIRFAGDGTTPTSGLAMSEFMDEIDRSTLNSSNNPKFVLPIEIADGAKKYLEIKEPPAKKAEAIEREKLSIIESFDADQYNYGGTARFSGIVDGTMYSDAFYGGIPKLLEEKGYDYLDFDILSSGYPGDLFGYSVAISKNRLIVGSPFAAFTTEGAIEWADVSGNTPRYEQASGTVLGYGGGAGIAYLYERGNRVLSDYGVEAQAKSWNLTNKFRPTSINVGQDLCLNSDERALSESGYKLGPNNYTINDLRFNSFVTDQFGYSVDIFEDVLVIGAPGHDFGNHKSTVFNSGEFINKEFNNAFDIPVRTVTDIGESGLRNLLTLSGSGVNAVLNNGAVYTYEDQISDWNAGAKNWIFKEKILSQGFNSNTQKDYVGAGLTPVSGSENDSFGKSISINIEPRTDSHYILAVGSPRHKFATSGNHTSFTMRTDTGAAYVFDGVLRRPEDSTASTGTFIQAKLYSNSGIDRSETDSTDFVSLEVHNSGGLNMIHEATGIVYSNEYGEIFLEASGQDLNDRSFSAHRPFIKEITGLFEHGVETTGLFRLFTEGQGPVDSGSMNLFVKNADGIVYNRLDEMQEGINYLGLYANAPAVPQVSGAFSGSGLSLYTSGVLST